MKMYHDVSWLKYSINKSNNYNEAYIGISKVTFTFVSPKCCHIQYSNLPQTSGLTYEYYCSKHSV